MAPSLPAGDEPQILEIPDQKMAVVYARGAPDAVFPQALPPLYNSVYSLKFELNKKGLPSFKVSGLRARYPDAHLVPVEAWTHVIGLPIPEEVTAIPQQVGGTEVRIETWKYGTVAQALHHGQYNEEETTLTRLHSFISDSGYKIIGVHEEEYLSGPDAETPETIIRYRVEKR